MLVSATQESVDATHTAEFDVLLPFKRGMCDCLGVAALE